MCFNAITCAKKILKVVKIHVSGLSETIWLAHNNFLSSLFLCSTRHGFATLDLDSDHPRVYVWNIKRNDFRPLGLRVFYTPFFKRVFLEVPSLRLLGTVILGCCV